MRDAEEGEVDDGVGRSGRGFEGGDVQSDGVCFRECQEQKRRRQEEQALTHTWQEKSVARDAGGRGRRWGWSEW